MVRTIEGNYWRKPISWKKKLRVHAAKRPMSNGFCNDVDEKSVCTALEPLRPRTPQDRRPLTASKPLSITSNPADEYSGVRIFSTYSKVRGRNPRRSISVRSRSGSTPITTSKSPPDAQILRKPQRATLSPTATARRRLPHGKWIWTSSAMPSSSAGRSSTAA